MPWPSDHQQWFACEADLQSMATRIISEVDIRYTKSNGLNDPIIYAAALLFRTLQSSRACFLLSFQGFVVESNTIARSCVENALWLRGLQQRGLSFVQDILSDGMRAEASIAEMITRMPGVILDEEAQRLAEAQIRSKSKVKIAPGNITSSEAAQRDYAVFRLISNNHAHPSTRSLDRHVVRDPQSGVYTLAMEPDASPRDLLWPMFVAAGASLTSVGLFLETFPVEKQETFNERGYGKSLQELTDRFRTLGLQAGLAGADNVPASE